MDLQVNFSYIPYFLLVVDLISKSAVSKLHSIANVMCKHYGVCG